MQELPGGGEKESLPQGGAPPNARCYRPPRPRPPTTGRVPSSNTTQQHWNWQLSVAALAEAEYNAGGRHQAAVYHHHFTPPSLLPSLHPPPSVLPYHLPSLPHPSPPQSIALPQITTPQLCTDVTSISLIGPSLPMQCTIGIGGVVTQ